MTHSEVKLRLVSIQEQEFSGPADPDLIARAETSFPASFPNDFKEFLLLYGSGFIESEEFIGLGGPNHLDVVWMANHLRSASSHKELPASYVPLRADGFGNYDCIDLASSGSGQSTIVAWIHDVDQEVAPEVLSRDYWDWFNGVLDLAVES